MSQERIAIRLIVDVASKHEATLIEQNEVDASFAVKVRRVDGKHVTYYILTYARGAEVRAKENGTNWLPAFCPDRHINGDGSFCLYWSEQYRIHITSVEAARLWWATLHGYLRLQERAAYARAWTGSGWAHGDAARYQFEALNSAKLLEKRFVMAIQHQRLNVIKVPTKNPANGVTMHLLLDDALVCSVRQNERRMSGKFGMCRFRLKRRDKSPRKIKSQEERAITYTRLLTSIWNWKVSEEEYRADYSNMTCCGTLDSCCLRTGMNQ